MYVIMKAIEPAAMTGWIERLARSADERQERRKRRTADPGIGTAGSAAVIPGDKAIAGLGDEAVALGGWAASAVIHGIAALPLLFNRALENRDVIGVAEKWREQTVFVTSARGAIRDLAWIIRSPPDFIGTGRWRCVWARATGNRRGQSVGIAGRVRTKALRAVHIVVIAAVQCMGQSGLF